MILLINQFNSNRYTITLNHLLYLYFIHYNNYSPITSGYIMNEMITIRFIY